MPSLCKTRVMDQTYATTGKYWRRIEFSESCGEYFMWAACDDKWDPNQVLTLSDALNARLHKRIYEESVAAIQIRNILQEICFLVTLQLLIHSFNVAKAT